MKTSEYPQHYQSIKKRFPALIEAVERLGKTLGESGPLDEKTAHLIQLAAAAAIHSQGSVHSHVRRALEAGAQESEIYHALILLTSTIGFPRTAAAISWADDVIQK
ncbi:MAG: carboxymuconolactone decarboxylase family protein [Calditrichia bacterium]